MRLAFNVSTVWGEASFPRSLYFVLKAPFIFPSREVFEQICQLDGWSRWNRPFRQETSNLVPLLALAAAAE